MKELTKRSFKALITRAGWVVGIGLVIYLIHGHPTELVWHAGDLPWTAVLGVAICTILANICQGIRYYYLLPDAKVPFWRVAFLPFSIHSANILLPFRGGETVQPLLISKWDPTQKLPNLIYWLLIDKALEFFAMLPFLAVTAWWFDYKYYQVLGLAILSFPLMLIYLTNTKQPPRNFVLAYVWAILSWVFNVLAFVPVIDSLKVSMGLVVGTSFGSAIPALPASLGTYEYVFVWVCQRAGLTGDRYLILAVASHAVSILVTLAIGLVLGAVWGWPSREERIEAQAKYTPKKHRVSNAIVFLCGAFTVISSGVLWADQIPPAHKRKPRGDANK